MFSKKEVYIIVGIFAIIGIIAGIICLIHFSKLMMAISLSSLMISLPILVTLFFTKDK